MVHQGQHLNEQYPERISENLSRHFAVLRRICSPQSSGSSPMSCSAAFSSSAPGQPAADLVRRSLCQRKAPMHVSCGSSASTNERGRKPF
jgi:hypothetical protein